MDPQHNRLPLNVKLTMKMKVLKWKLEGKKKQAPGAAGGGGGGGGGGERERGNPVFEFLEDQQTETDLAYQCHSIQIFFSFPSDSQYCPQTEK